MAEQADFYVKNKFSGAIDVTRNLPGGGSDLKITIAPGNEEKIYLVGTDSSLTIKAPGGIDTKGHPIDVKSDLDLAVSFSRTTNSWKINIVPNNIVPDLPTTVNISVGGDLP